MPIRCYCTCIHTYTQAFTNTHIPKCMFQGTKSPLNARAHPLPTTHTHTHTHTHTTHTTHAHTTHTHRRLLSIVHDTHTHTHSHSHSPPHNTHNAHTHTRTHTADCCRLLGVRHSGGGGGRRNCRLNHCRSRQRGLCGGLCVMLLRCS